MKTTSELAFEKFLADHGLLFQRVEEQQSPRPDYLVQIGDLRIFFEIKELSEDQNFSTEISEVSHRIVGDHIRSKIGEAKRQIQFGAGQGIPSVLLVYNNLDPMFLFGTEDHDFISAMYGERTVLLDRNSKIVDSFHGRNRSVAEGKNTSFSAVGRFRPVRGGWEVKLFENPFAKLKLPALPPCFEVQRVEFESSSAGPI